jgi:hypothetical protein
LILNMKAPIHQRIRNGACAVILLGVAITGGFFMGRSAGDRLVRGVLLRESKLPLLLSRPVYQFYDIYTLLNSGNPFSRLSGYYSLVDAKMIDIEFIRERYDREQVPVIRRTLLWVLGFSRDRAAALKFYASRYDTGDEETKKDILAMMKRLDPAFYGKFIKKKLDARGPGKGK